MSFDNVNEFILQRQKKLALPYFSFTIVKDGEVLDSYSYYEDGNPNDLLAMYSMSKPITSAALFQLVEKGLVSIDDPVSKYLDGFENLTIASTGEKAKNPLLIKHCLSMTGGLDYNLGRPAILKAKEETLDLDTVGMVHNFVEDGLLFDPGTSYQYSLSMDVIAAIVEKVSGERFSDYVEKHIFSVLGMSRSTFSHDEDLGNKCRPEFRPENGNINPYQSYYKGFVLTSNYESGGAGLISTVEDYAKFASSLANKDGRILKDSSVDIMTTIVTSETPFGTINHEYSKSSIEYGYGYGVRVRKSESEGLPVGEFGWDGACGCYSLIDRKNNLAIVVGMTLQMWPDYVKDFHIALSKAIYKDLGLSK